MSKAKPRPGRTPDRPDEHAPRLVRISLQLPRRQARKLDKLGLTFDCGGAVATPRGSTIVVDAIVEVGTVAEIVASGVPVLVTEAIPIRPLPRSTLARSARAWFAQTRKLG